MGDGPAVRASVEAMEKEVDGVLLIDDGITVLTLAVFDETAATNECRKRPTANFQ